MSATHRAINNSATPAALQHYIPVHLLEPSNREYYEAKRILCELQVRGVALGIEKSVVDPTRPPVIRIQAEYAQHISAPDARAVALALLQLADVLEEQHGMRASAQQAAAA